MRFTLHIHTDGAAFVDEMSGEPDPAPELARILRGVADRIETGDEYGHFRTIHDYNGNDCGRFRLETDEGIPTTTSRAVQS